MDEKAELRALQAEYRKLGKLFDALGQVKPGNPESLDQLEKRLQALPSGELLGRAVEELRRKTQAFLDRVRHYRSEAFRRIETDFIREVRAREQFVRELDSGWRVGPFEIQVRREQSRVRFLYNHEVMIDWSPVGDGVDLDALQAKAVSMLESAALPEEQLTTVFWEAYQQLGRAQERGSELVPILDFYREVRVALVRHELQARRPDARLSHTEFPRWAFLYNVDRYRALRSQLDGGRVGFETGSQQESRTKGMVVNGLDPRSDTRVVCYVVATAPPRL